MTLDQFIDKKMKNIRCDCGGENETKGRADIHCKVCDKDNTLMYVFIYKLLENDYYRLYDDRI